MCVLQREEDVAFLIRELADGERLKVKQLKETLVTIQDRFFRGRLSVDGPHSSRFVD